MEEMTTDDVLERFRQSEARTRKTTLRVIEGRASEDRTTRVVDVLDFLERDRTVRSVELIGSRLCDCGRVLDADTRLEAVAACGAVTCTECRVACVRCGRSLCQRRASVYSDGEVWCLRCRPIKWLRLFFDIRTAPKI